ncbi:MAG: hypothetical protein ACODAJ_03135 [Planctomycetota bacterium]
MPRELARLRVLADACPRAFFFRSAEAFAARRNITYEQWERCFSRLMGIEGKCLDEEIAGRSRRNIDFFTRFKKAHPHQLVLLHYNGNARDPRYQTEKFFAGHWVYFNGATILSDVPAEQGETVLRVSDPSLFRTEMGRYRDKNEDVGLCALDEQGRPDWHRSEQVELLAVDAKAGTIRVRRGCFATAPRAFPAGKAYAAAHVTEGPWGPRNHLMWYYNYSTRCPRDAQGKTCADVHAAELAARFAPGGELAAFDGVEFDVLHNECGRRGRRAPDCDADGKPDGGWFDGVNAYGIGVAEFVRQLRQRVGEGTIIQADGMSTRNQRAFGLLNGIESEGWPALWDWEVRDWSGGLNRHFFWAARGRPPAFNYVNHKYVSRGDAPGRIRRPDVPWSIHRLALSAAVFTDAAICCSFTPPREPGERLGVWDELRMGTAHRTGWLGKPLGPAVRLATRQPDRLDGVGWQARLAGEGVRVTKEGGAVRVSARDEGASQLRFRLRGVPCDGPDLLVMVAARGRRRRGYPKEMARLAHVGIAPPEGQLVRRDLPETGMRLRKGKEQALDRETGASLRWREKTAIGGEAHPAYFVHPPYRGGTGYTFWQRDVTVPEGGRLEFYTGMGAKSPERSDGVWFRVQVAALADGKPGPYEQVFEHSQNAHRWVHHSVPLAKWGGKTVRLRFISDCGPENHSTTDHSSWGDVWVTPPGGLDAVTRPVRHMTWVDEDRFTSSFYFREVRSKTVDLEFTIEGSEAVWVERIAAYAHPDAMVRAFERGVVVANPAPRPYTFDLAAIFPGQAFRRLQGSPRQDPETNNGEAVGTTLTLGAKDALFLVRSAP